MKIMAGRVCTRVGGDLIYISFINHYYMYVLYSVLHLLFLGLIEKEKRKRKKEK